MKTLSRLLPAFLAIGVLVATLLVVLPSNERRGATLRGVPPRGPANPVPAAPADAVRATRQVRALDTTEANHPFPAKSEDVAGGLVEYLSFPAEIGQSPKLVGTLLVHEDPDNPLRTVARDPFSLQVVSDALAPENTQWSARLIAASPSRRNFLWTANGRLDCVWAHTASGETATWSEDVLRNSPKYGIFPQPSIYLLRPGRSLVSMWEALPKARAIHWPADGVLAFLLDEKQIIVRDVARNTEQSFGPFVLEGDQPERLVNAAVAPPNAVVLTESAALFLNISPRNPGVVRTTPYRWVKRPQPDGVAVWAFRVVVTPDPARACAWFGRYLPKRDREPYRIPSDEVWTLVVSLSSDGSVRETQVDLAQIREPLRDPREESQISRTSVALHNSLFLFDSQRDRLFLPCYRSVAMFNTKGSEALLERLWRFDEDCLEIAVSGILDDGRPIVSYWLRPVGVTATIRIAVLNFDSK